MKITPSLQASTSKKIKSGKPPKHQDLSFLAEPPKAVKWLLKHPLEINENHSWQASRASERTFSGGRTPRYTGSPCIYGYPYTYMYICIYKGGCMNIDVFIYMYIYIEGAPIYRECLYMYRICPYTYI